MTHTSTGGKSGHDGELLNADLGELYRTYRDRLVNYAARWTRNRPGPASGAACSRACNTCAPSAPPEPTYHQPGPGRASAPGLAGIQSAPLSPTP